MNRIPGNPVGVPNPKTDWNQTDETKADFLKNAPRYLSDFFKPIPEGKTLDDLNKEEYIGVYLTHSYASYNDVQYKMPTIVMVAMHNYFDADMLLEYPIICQTMICCEALDEDAEAIIQRRTYNNGKWSNFAPVYATKKFVTEEVERQLGDEIVYPELMDTVDLDYNPDSANAQSGIAVAQALDGSVGAINNALEEVIELQNSLIDGNGYIPSGGEVKYFPYEPQIDITLEEAVQKLEFNEINGISWADSDFTAVKVLVENAVLETAGPNTQVCVYINSRGYTPTQTPLGSPTTFINGTKKQYWSCYADLKSGLMISCDASATNELWVSGISMPINMKRLNLKEKLEFISIEYMNPSEAFPVGTRFRIWLR